MLPTLHAEFIVALSWVFLSNVYSQSTGCGNVNTVLQNNNAEGAWPWMVAITRKETDGHYIHWCNGFLIDRRHVLSAAHCFDINDKDFVARIGKRNRNEGEAYDVTCIIKHPRYESGQHYDDIAILTLSRMVDTPNYNPICLPDENLRIKRLSGVEVTKTAWGAVKLGGIINETLIQNAGLRIMSNKNCNIMFGNLMSFFMQRFPGLVSGDMVCTENPTEQMESCERDSGAPLMYRDESNKWIAVGVSAFGLSCRTDAPSVFIRISDYLEWIAENTIDDSVVHCSRFSDEDLNQLTVHYDDKDILAGSTAIFSCQVNDRKLSGKSESVCCRNGNWSSPPPQCKGDNFMSNWKFQAPFVEGNTSSYCSESGKTSSYLDAAIEIIHKFKTSLPKCSATEINFPHGPVDCADILSQGQNTSGVYRVWPMSRLTDEMPQDVYCDMETDGGGWTVIQRRGNYGRPVDYFYKDWKSYKEGFGDIEKDFWLGNDNIFALTNQKMYSARFDLEDKENSKRFAVYDYFWIDDEIRKYTLHLGNYSGDAGNSMRVHNNQKFSTKDQDNDSKTDEHCAISFRGAWWYNECRWSNLNGLYLRGETVRTSVNWWSFKEDENLESTEIKIRPKKFKVTKDL